MNTQNPSCYSCKGFKAIVDKVQKGRKTELDKKLKVCAICKCFTKAMVHVDVKILKETTSKKSIKKYPDYCWKRKELEEHYENI